MLEDSGARLPSYGVSASPLVLDGVVVVAAGGPDGGALVGYDAATGALRWSGGNGSPAYGSPRHAVLAGLPQILVMNGDAVAGHDPASGRVLWRQAWPPGENTAQPVILPGDRVFFSTGYGVGGKMFRVRWDGAGGAAADPLWESRGLKAKFTTVVHRDGFLYGLDDGILVCLDAETGERRWKRGRHGHGQILLVDDLLVVSGEDGSVALVEADPEAWRELGRFAAIEGKTWNHPALAGPLLLVRNAREAACYELPLVDGS
jgi:outer membrane protein assembly factor BamB